ncbi:MAG: glycoside hydrolase family 57 protein [Candidatus Altiarchaeota archaeon]
MTSICLYFQVHQPMRLRWFWPGDASLPKSRLEDRYFDHQLNEWTLHKVAGKCYHRANEVILNSIDYFKGERKKFKVSYSLSGVFLDQAERWDPDLLEEFKQMAESGCVEFLCETYYHSLSSLFEDRTEFIEQVRLHEQAIKDLLGVKAHVFRNTELLYHDGIAEEIEEMGFSAIMTEGIERILDGWKSPNYIYKRRGGRLPVLLRNYKLSDDIGYRFGAKWWSEHPLTADKYSAWLAGTPGETVNVFMDYETFGEHQWEDTGIFWFLGSLPGEVLKWDHLEFATPSEVVEKYHPRGDISVPWYETVSWADMERDASAWLGNHAQRLNFENVKQMEKLVKASGDPEFLRIWRYLLTSDHFYYMCTKSLSDGDVHNYFSHHGNPFDAGLNYMAIASDFKEKIAAGKERKSRSMHMKKSSQQAR